MTPRWSVPAQVRAVCTERMGGVSVAPFASLNLGTHVGDEPVAVTENRRRVRVELELPAEPFWLHQVHGTVVADPDEMDAIVVGSAVVADAAVTRVAGRVLAILVADCMPVLFANDTGTVIAAAHAGWRGLVAGVLEATVSAMKVSPQSIQAWLGPAIGTQHFEVGDEVRDAFMQVDAQAVSAFGLNSRSRWQCNLALLARQRLEAVGVRRIDYADRCTYAEPEHFFSHRRDGRDGRTGRMAALIWRALEAG